jgi:hypothetical protein
MKPGYSGSSSSSSNSTKTKTKNKKERGKKEIRKNREWSRQGKKQIYK